jgi:hypothetical protein
MILKKKKKKILKIVNKMMIIEVDKDNLEKKKCIRAVIDKIEISSIKKKIINKMTRSNNIMIKTVKNNINKMTEKVDN